MFELKGSSYKDSFIFNGKTLSGQSSIYKLIEIKNTGAIVNSDINGDIEISNINEVLKTINLNNSIFSEECILIKDHYSKKLNLIPISHKKAQELFNKQEKISLKQGNEYIIDVNGKKEKLIYLGIHFEYKISFNKDYKERYKEVKRAYDRNLNYIWQGEAPYPMPIKEEIAFHISKVSKNIFIFFKKETNEIEKFSQRNYFLLEKLLSTNNFISIDNLFKDNVNTSENFYTTFFEKKEEISLNFFLEKIEVLKKLLINKGILEDSIL